MKANPSPELLTILNANGVTHFDVASIAEVRLVREALPGADVLGQQQRPVICVSHGLALTNTRISTHRW